MDIDVYQPCPCHADKKIKFCCGKEIVNDLNQVLAKNSSGQALAALDQLDRAIKKFGPKDCLLTIQTHILIANDELEKAKESNEQFARNNPKHSTGFHHRALIQLAEGETLLAVNSLQDAMDAITGTDIPISLSNAFRMIGLGLLAEGHLVGARAHLQYALGLKNGQDDELQRMVYETFRMPQASILLKDEFLPQRPPEGVEWEKTYSNVMRTLDRGQFRKGLQFLQKIDSQFPDQPVVVRSIALMHMYLGHQAEMVDAWRRYSRLPGVGRLDAIEAEALAQHFSMESLTETIDIVRVTYEVTEADGPMEAALSSPRLASINSVGEDPFEEGPPPRAAFYVLDRDNVASAAELTLDHAPQVAGELLLYGKQTDRAARLELITTQKKHVEVCQPLVSQAFKDFLAGEPKLQKVGETTALDETITWNWHLPPDTTREQHEELVRQKNARVILEDWVRLPFSVLDNQSPLEVKDNPEYAIPLQALILQIEQSPDGQGTEAETLAELKRRLGIEPTEKIDLAALPDGTRLSPIQQQAIDFQKLSDHELVNIQSDAMAIGNLQVLKCTVPEILNRPDFDLVPRDVSYSMMAHLTDDTDQALEYLTKARTEAKRLNRPIGMYLVQEFDFRISKGLTEKLPGLLQTIQMHHLQDPEVEYQLSRVLEKYGLLRGNPADRPEESEPATSASGAIWTPEGGAPMSAAPGEPTGAEKTEPSKLWVPD